MSTHFVNHTADIQFITRSRTKETLFEECVSAVVSYIKNNCSVRISTKKKTLFQGGDDAQLLYKLLEEVLYLIDSERFLTNKAKVAFTKGEMTATLYGSTLREARGFHHVKAVTYADMYVKRDGLGWKAQVVLDV